MTIPIKNRIESLDLLKGIVMVIMALDHVRDYFHFSALLYNPTDPSQTSLPIYFTRWITHFCAPTFCFLAGISAFLVGRRKTKAELSSFLLKRGIWLAVIELTIVNFAWNFDITFSSSGLAVIWSLGISMIFLSALIHLPKTWIIIFSCVVIFGHDLADSIHYPQNFWWAIVHDGGSFTFFDHFNLTILYPIIPWIGVMSLGYCFGNLFESSYDPLKRKKTINIIGASTISLFFIVRYINIYGDPEKWISYDTVLKTGMSFMDPNKYPPSLSYLLMTLGLGLLFLANSEHMKGKVVDFFRTFGRVPFFYYILHLYLIHLIALIFAQYSGFGWQSMIFNDWGNPYKNLTGYGFHLWVVYAVWAAVILILYPLCKRFDNYKMNHKEKWWLSYL